MIKKLNKYINISLIISSLLLVLGLIMFIFPNTSLKVFAYALSIILLVFGLYLIIEDIRLSNYGFFAYFTLVGLNSILLGVILLIYPDLLSILIPVILGIWFILSSIIKIKITTLLSYEKDSSWIISLIMSILSIACGILLIISPLASAKIIVSFVGILLFVYTLSDIIDMMIFKKNINKIHKSLKSKIIEID